MSCGQNEESWNIVNPPITENPVANTPLIIATGAIDNESELIKESSEWTSIIPSSNYLIIDWTVKYKEYTTYLSGSNNGWDTPWEPLPWSDASTFQVSKQDPISLARDKNNVYFGKQILIWADPTTFKFIWTIWGEWEFISFYWDKNYIYSKPIIHSDGTTTDAKVIEWLDWYSFQLIGNLLAKDVKNIYLFDLTYNYKILDWADPITFIVANPMNTDDTLLWEDNSFIYNYKEWKIIKSSKLQ